MVAKAIAELASRVADLERRVAGTMRHGRVAEVDPKRGRVRLDLGEGTGGETLLSPWVPYGQTAGALKAHVPPSVGQQLSLLAPAGDWQQAVAVPLTFSDQEPSPSEDGAENVITYGNVRLTLRDDLVRIVVGGSTLEITGDEIKMTTPKFTGVRG
ncbi:MAG: phage baseplate assembly protein V [Loktanella sp.]|nr:phage baseplate assembly protein V [Loktanella sp.]